MHRAKSEFHIVAFSLKACFETFSDEAPSTIGAFSFKAWFETFSYEAPSTSVIIECIRRHWSVDAFLCNYNREDAPQQDVTFTIKLTRDINTRVIHLYRFIVVVRFFYICASFLFKREPLDMQNGGVWLFAFLARSLFRTTLRAVVLAVKSEAERFLG